MPRRQKNRNVSVFFEPAPDVLYRIAALPDELTYDHENASLDLIKGDKLKGVVTLKTLELATLFGSVKVGPSVEATAP